MYYFFKREQVELILRAFDLLSPFYKMYKNKFKKRNNPQKGLNTIDENASIKIPVSDLANNGVEYGQNI